MTKVIFNVVLILMFFVSSQSVFAQQTIITVPSSELVPTGDLFVKESNRFGTFSNGTNVSITPSATLGLGWNTQLTTGISTSLDKNKFHKAYDRCDGQSLFESSCASRHFCLRAFVPKNFKNKNNFDCRCLYER